MKRSLLSLALAALTISMGCSRHERASANSAALPAVRVKITQAHFELIPELTEITGLVRPLHRATLAAKLMGSIEALPVTLGQRVQAGDILAKISAGEISARLAQAQAQRDQANHDLTRERDLLPQHASTADLVHSLTTRVALADATVREAEIMLSYAIIRAPFDGVIAHKFVEVGDLAAPGVPLIEIEGASAFQIEAGIPDSLLGTLTPGTLANIAIPSAHLTFTAALTELSSAADAQAHTVTAKFAVPPQSAVRSGQFTRVQLPGAPVRSLLVPSSAVTALGQMERIFVMNPDHRAVLRLVKTGAVHGARQEILAGLDEGEFVVLNPPTGLREGQSLEVLP